MKGISALPRPPQAVVFDMDGLLVDTETLYRQAVASQTREMGLELSGSFLTSTVGLSASASRQAYQAHYGADFPYDEFWEKASEKFYQLAHSELRLKAGVHEILDLLDGMKLPRAVATSSRHQDVQHHLGTHGILDRFHYIVAQGDYTRGKPDPDPYLIAARQLGVAPHFCLALEDSYNGVRSASTAGLMTIMVPDLLPVTAEMENLCVGVSKDLHEVMTLLQMTGLKFAQGESTMMPMTES